MFLRSSKQSIEYIMSNTYTDNVLIKTILSLIYMKQQIQYDFFYYVLLFQTNESMLSCIQI